MPHLRSLCRPSHSIPRPGTLPATAAHTVNVSLPKDPSVSGWAPIPPTLCPTLIPPVTTRCRAARMPKRPPPPPPSVGAPYHRRPLSALHATAAALPDLDRRPGGRAAGRPGGQTGTWAGRPVGDRAAGRPCQRGSSSPRAVGEGGGRPPPAGGGYSRSTGTRTQRGGRAAPTGHPVGSGCSSGAGGVQKNLPSIVGSAGGRTALAADDQAGRPPIPIRIARHQSLLPPWGETTPPPR